MAIPDTNKIIRAYLVQGGTSLYSLINTRVFVPRLPEGTQLPAISMFSRGGVNNPYLKGLQRVSVQFDCWADNPITAREVYLALHDRLQGLQNETVTIGQDSYCILSAIEEVAGQDLQDGEIPNYFRVLTFYEMLIR